MVVPTTVTATIPVTPIPIAPIAVATIPATSVVAAATVPIPAIIVPSAAIPTIIAPPAIVAGLSIVAGLPVGLTVSAIAAESRPIARWRRLGGDLSLGRLRRFDRARAELTAATAVALRAIAAGPIPLGAVALFQTLLPVAPLHALTPGLRRGGRRLGHDHDGQSRHCNLHHRQIHVGSQKATRSSLG